MVRTASGPGGRSGPLRVDLQGRYAYNPLQVRLPAKPARVVVAPCRPSTFLSARHPVAAATRCVYNHV